MRAPRGQATVWVLLLLSTAILGGAAMAVDLGRMYTIQTEIHTVAESAAMAAATRLIGTVNSTTNADQTARSLLFDSSGHDNCFNLRQNMVLGSGDLAVSITQDYFTLRDGALLNSGGGQAASMAHYVRVD